MRPISQNQYLDIQYNNMISVIIIIIFYANWVNVLCKQVINKQYTNNMDYKINNGLSTLYKIRINANERKSVSEYSESERERACHLGRRNK